MAAVVALMARDQGGPHLVFQLLLFPATDFRLNTPSIEEFAEDYNSVSKGEMIWIRKHYLPNEADITHPLASPLLASDVSRLPAAFIMTAECDGLRDEGEFYGKRLQEAGVPVHVSRYDGMIHDFLDLFEEPGNRGVDEIASVLRAAFGKLESGTVDMVASKGAPATAQQQQNTGGPLNAFRQLFRRRKEMTPALASSHGATTRN